MKYIKLFESFDRYEFGQKFGNLEQICGDIKRAAIKMTGDEVDILKAEFGEQYYVSPQLILCFGGEVLGAMVAPSVKPRLMNCVYILSLGDYIYGLVYYEREENFRRGVIEKISKIFICDAMEEVVDNLHAHLWKK